MPCSLRSPSGDRQPEPFGFGDNAPARVAEIFRQMLDIPSEGGVIFKPETLRLSWRGAGSRST